MAVNEVNTVPVERATKEFWVPCTTGTNPEESISWPAGFRLPSAAALTAMIFSVPADFSAITSTVIVRHARATGTHRLNYYTFFGALGEDSKTHTATDVDVDTEETDTLIYEYDISSLLAGLAAGDYVTIWVSGDATNRAVNATYGLKFKYS